ncbi:hypothetical protein BG015_005790, partial [Linnemannia schmuckeri]
VVIDAFEESCWPELCELSIGGPAGADQDLATILRVLPSRRLASFDWSNDLLGPLTYNCLREVHFDHLQSLIIGECTGVTSAMVQEVLTSCVHLDIFDAPYIFVRDIATAPKPWGCLKLENLAIYIAKQEEDEVEWDGLVFRQISRLGRLQSLDLRRSPHIYDDPVRSDAILQLDTLDFCLPSSFSIKSSSENGSNDSSSVSGGDIRCWSSLIQMRQFSFDGDRQMLGIQEALWMTEHWRDLWCICGKFRGVESDDVDNLEKFFEEKGISYFD